MGDLTPAIDTARLAMTIRIPLDGVDFGIAAEECLIQRIV
jgi:hypothetical protein